MSSRVRIEMCSVRVTMSGTSSLIEARVGGRWTGAVVDDLLHCLWVVCSRCKVYGLLPRAMVSGIRALVVDIHWAMNWNEALNRTTRGSSQYWR